MKPYQEGLQRLASGVKLVNAVLQHSENLELSKDWWYSDFVCDYVMEDKFSNDPFPKISRFDWNHVSGIQLLIRIDTPIKQVKKIEAPSPTVSKEVSTKDLKFNLATTMDDGEGNQESQFKNHNESNSRKTKRKIRQMFYSQGKLSSMLQI